jgi:hypothetical protein
MTTSKKNMPEQQIQKGFFSTSQMKWKFFFCWLNFFCISWILGLNTKSAVGIAISFHYPASDEAISNPFIGSATWADDSSEREQPFTLVYADLTWAEFEPTQGIYDFESFEKNNHFDLWREQGKHVIFRFVTDMPGQNNHRDIPDWLYNATGKDGKAYAVSYGRGYSPNYANPIFIEAHAKAIAALGKRYGKDPFFAYIELGSLGHWGEWHIHPDVASMPSVSICRQYILPYVSAFPDAKLMLRRPFAAAGNIAVGLFNDAAGEQEPTEAWLTWIETGEDTEQSAESELLLPMPEAWQSNPIGGELSTKMKHQQLLGELLPQTLDLFARSHTSWIGPGSFVKVERDGNLQPALDQVNRLIGYRLRISKSEISKLNNGDYQFTLTWHNDGIAPFYFDWKAYLRIVGDDGQYNLMPLPMHLIEIQPGVEFPVTLTIPQKILFKGENRIETGIVDPSNGRARVTLAMVAPHDDFWYELLSLQQ